MGKKSTQPTQGITIIEWRMPIQFIKWLYHYSFDKCFPSNAFYKTVHSRLLHKMQQISTFVVLDSSDSHWSACIAWSSTVQGSPKDCHKIFSLLRSGKAMIRDWDLRKVKLVSSTFKFYPGAPSNSVMLILWTSRKVKNWDSRLVSAFTNIKSLI